MTNRKAMQKLPTIEYAKHIKALSLWSLPEIVRWLKSPVDQDDKKPTDPNGKKDIS